MQFFCALFYDLLCKISNGNLIFYRPLGRRFWATGGSYQKLFNSVLSAHRLRVYATFSLALIVAGHDRKLDGQTVGLA